MANIRFLASLGTAVALMLAPLSAEARFGKRSGGSSGSSSGSSGGAHAASPGSSYVAVPSYRGSYYYRPYYYGYGFPGYYFGWGYYPYAGFYPPYTYYPYAYPYAYPAPQSIGQQAPRSEIKLTLGAEGVAHVSGQAFSGGQAFNGGGSFGLNLALEGKRLGLNTQFTSIFAKGEDVFGGDTIKLLNIYGTYALAANERGRLRIEAGLVSAFAPDLTVAGPGLGFSGIVQVIGPLGIEGAVHGTVYPFHELDWNAGLALAIGQLGIRGGWRRIFLDDRGLVDPGINHQDRFSGPYLGLALVF